MFILTLILNGYKLSRNFNSIVIFRFMPSPRPVLVSSCDLSLALIGELGLVVHNRVVVIVRPIEIGLKDRISVHMDR